MKAHEIEVLADIRTIPKSRYNPQFTQENLKQSLQDVGIDYQYIKDLGGLRKALPNSPNTGWHNSSFRGYADYMRTDDFKKALLQLMDLGNKKRTAMMCAEASEKRCHRSLVADALWTRNIKVLHIMSGGTAKPHKLTDFAHIQGDEILYLSETAYFPGLD